MQELLLLLVHGRRKEVVAAAAAAEGAACQSRWETKSVQVATGAGLWDRWSAQVAPGTRMGHLGRWTFRGVAAMKRTREEMHVLGPRRKTGALSR